MNKQKVEQIKKVDLLMKLAISLTVILVGEFLYLGILK